MPAKNLLVRIGDVLFKYRNIMFPAALVGLCVLRPPLSTFDGSTALEHVKDGFAVFVMLLGLGIRAAVIGFKYIKRGGLNKKVYAENLVTDGFFATCRNPLYVGNIVMYAGIFLMHGDPLVMLVGMAMFLFIYTAIVAAEEYFLREKFGDAYVAYCRDVPRWLPRIGRLRAATQGMTFNVRRVIAKDYTTVVNGLFALMVIEFWERIMHYESLHLLVFAGLLLLMVAVLVTVKSAKKHGLFGAI